ncbi:glycerate kinase type-2 family protein [Neisseria sp. Ec49-e6-T10]|uniref:glycerate kinase type-2 family protein n=1 Tax=Neisseria sp. Ec49-e6-T10 TaxID=3140744 RepID=UPI003EB7B6CE
MNQPPQRILKDLFQTVLSAAMPEGKMASFLPKEPPKGKTIVLGAGKAAASMAAELERIYPFPIEGMVITRYQHGEPTKYIEVIEASHPVPDQNGTQAALKLYEWAKSATEDDLVIFLVSGGASALMALPAQGITLEDKKYITRQLLASGAPIEEMNIVRKHLSAIKGGRLAQIAAPAHVLTLAISDVVGDDFSAIGSGPTVPDPSTFADVTTILNKYNINIPESVKNYLSSDTQAKETPKQLTNTEAHLIVTPQKAFLATQEAARNMGLNVLFLGDALTGEARHVAAVHAGIAHQIKMHDTPVSKPALILSGGETTVTVTGENGRGGRNAEFLLALAIELKGMDNVYAIACDTDGIDGSEDNAGAMIGPDTLQRASEQLNLIASDFLAKNDAYTFFSYLDDLVVTQPTRTNINDFRAILIL